MGYTVYCGDHRVNPDGMFAGLQRSAKMLYLCKYSQHDTAVNPGNYFLNPRSRNKIQIFLAIPKQHTFCKPLCWSCFTSFLVQMGDQEDI